MTPRYLRDRIRVLLYERKYPDLPWLTPSANTLLESLIRPADRGLEWGSGRSTTWFARRMSHLTSVESSPEWYARVREDLSRRELRNVEYRFESLEPSADPARSPYVRVADQFGDGTLGFVLVDGDYREHCTLAVLPKVAAGGLLVLDNSNWYLDHPTFAPASRAGIGTLNPEWVEVERRLAGWRAIWTTSGVTDTNIWIRPSA